VCTDIIHIYRAVVGGMIIELLDDMVKAAGGRPVILINPNLADRPSSNNMMQIRGRSERRAIEQSFTDIFTIRLLYPSSGGYMFPIRGLVVKKDYRSLWVVYSRETNEKGQEVYSCIGAFPPHPAPSQDAISKLFTD
jgi:adenylate kinase